MSMQNDQDQGLDPTMGGQSQGQGQGQGQSQSGAIGGHPGHALNLSFKLTHAPAAAAQQMGGQGPLPQQMDGVNAMDNGQGTMQNQQSQIPDATQAFKPSSQLPVPSPMPKSSQPSSVPRPQPTTGGKQSAMNPRPPTPQPKKLGSQVKTDNPSKVRDRAIEGKGQGQNTSTSTSTSTGERRPPKGVALARKRQTTVLKARQSRETQGKTRGAPRDVDAGAGFWPPLSPLL